MTEGQVNEFSRALGALQATVAGLTSMWERNDREATEGRRRLYERVDDLVTQMSGFTVRLTEMEGRLQAALTEIASIKPSVEFSKIEHHEKVGSKKTLALIWTGLSGFIGATAGAAVEIVHMVWPHNPPPHP